MIEIGIIAMGIVFVPMVILCIGVIGYFIYYTTCKIGRDQRRK